MCLVPDGVFVFRRLSELTLSLIQADAFSHDTNNTTVAVVAVDLLIVITHVEIVYPGIPIHSTS